MKSLQPLHQVLYAQVAEDHWEKREEVVASYADLKSEIEGFHDSTYKAHKDIETGLDKYEKILTQFKNHTKKNVGQIFSSLKEIQDAIKEDDALNKKVIKSTEAYTKNSVNLTELLFLVKGFDFLGLKSFVESLQAAALKQDEHLARWVKSSTSMACSLGPRMTNIELTQAAIQYDVTSLKQDTFEIKSMMTEIFNAFEGQSSSDPLSNVPTTTLVITKGPATVTGENFAHTTTEEPPSQTEKEKADMDTKEAVEKQPTKEAK
ncbi:hypothetical protein Tco_0845332, partial [Tanacetum coccineum]